MSKTGIVFLGDFMLGRYVLPVIEKSGLKSLLDPISGLIAGRHVVANLESTLTGRHPPDGESGVQALHAPLGMAEELRKAGISAVSLANNHMFDYGVGGVRDTIKALDDSGIGHTGAGMDLDSAVKPVIIDVDGYRVGIIAFSYTPPARKGQPGVAYIYDETVDYAVSSAQKEVDFLIAMPHAGIELYQYPMPRDQTIYRRMIDLGVDLVVGSHPHCVQAMDVYQGKSIFYSLGDCIFDHHHEAVWEERLKRSGRSRGFSVIPNRSLLRQSLMVVADFADGRVEVAYEPMVTRDFPGPYPMVGDERKRCLAQFEDICSRLLHDRDVQEERIKLQERLMESLRARGLV